MRPCRSPGRAMSYEYRAAPETFCGPSIRFVSWPSNPAPAEGHGYFACDSGRAGAPTSGTWRALDTTPLLRVQHGHEDLWVRPAATNVSVERRARLFGGGLGMTLEQRHGGHDEPRRAEPAH